MIFQKKILEIGCGIGLVSLLLNKQHADISATDIHPEAGDFLAQNTNLNNGKNIPFERTSWNDLDTSLGEFDLIIGSDLLYEKESIISLANFIDMHTKLDSNIIIIDPGRDNHAAFSKKMVTLGYSHSQEKTGDTSYLETPYNGQVLQYKRQPRPA